MQIMCDMCCVVKNRQSSVISTAQLIHVSKSNKISLLCLQCLEKAEDEVFYLPLDGGGKDLQGEGNQRQQGEQKQQMKRAKKYIKRILSMNKEPIISRQVRRQIQQLFQKQICLPLKQLQETILRYRGVIAEYKKTVTSQYKAIVSKLDLSIVDKFKELVVQMHQQSIDGQKIKNKGNGQYGASKKAIGQKKQQLDIYVRSMKISVENQWNQTQPLVAAVRKSYEKFKNVFGIQKQELDKKTILLTKIIPKITLAFQYDKLLAKPLGSKQIAHHEISQTSKHIKKINSQRTVEIDPSQHIKHINSQGVVEIYDEDDTPVMLISDDEQDVEQKFIPKTTILNERQHHDISLKDPLEYAQIQQVGQTFIHTVNGLINTEEGFINTENGFINTDNSFINTVNGNLDQPHKENHNYCIQLEEDTVLVQFQCQQSHLKIKKIPISQGFKTGLGKHSNERFESIDPSRSNEIQKIMDQQTVNVGCQVRQKPNGINQSINLDDEDAENECQIDSRTSKPQSTSSKSYQKLPLTSCKFTDLQAKKPSVADYQQHQTFQISVQNYMNPLESLRIRMTTDFKIKKCLQKKNIILPNISNSSSVHKYSAYLQLIRKLKITYTRKKNLAQLLTLIPQCSQLQVLTVCEPLLASQDIVHFIITSLPKLVCLEFLCYNKLNNYHMKLIPEHLKNLQALYYGPKCFNNLALKSEYRQFREHKKEKRMESERNSELIALMKNLPSLRNVWISEFFQMETILCYLQSKDNFEHLILGKYVTDSSTMQLTQKSWNSLKKLTKLHSLALLNIRIDTVALETLLKNNCHTLKSLQIYGCANWSDQLASLLKRCRSLKEFYLFNSDQSIFKGHSLWDAISLQTLVLRCCQFMDFSAAQQKIAKLSHLKHIDVYGCEWFNDLILQQLVKNKYLTYLNLANTQIGSLFHQSLRFLFQIRCLALGSTRINAAAIEQLCAQFPQIQKLSLYNLQGSAVFNGRCMVKKNRLNKIGDILKGLKYIDVGSLNTADDSMFDHFKTIKTIYLWMATNLSPKKIQEIYLNGINVVDDV